MSSLQDLVPPVELCKLIPKGSFSKSTLYWAELAGVGMDVFPRECGRCPSFDVCGKDAIPAPTLQEIMSELPACDCYRFSDKNEWTVLLANGPADDGVKSDSPATAALKLWLKLKGIEDEQEQG